MMVHITKVVFSVLKQITVLYVALMEEGNMSNLYNCHPCLFRAQLLQSDQKKKHKRLEIQSKMFPNNLSTVSIFECQIRKSNEIRNLKCF